jgi:iron uptake system component EfeO
MHHLLLTDINAMLEAARDLESAAPTPPDRGWDATLDAQAIAAMKEAWVKARAAYEDSEGAIAPLFPNIDNAIDARYDDFMTQLAAQGGDENLFDDAGVTGMHAVERILYSNVTPQYVIDFEQALPGYVPAAFPKTAVEANELKSKLLRKFIADTESLLDQWTPANIDVAITFQGLISLMNEQGEKVQKASSFEEESRYSQRTMADLRDNLAGSKTAYAVFQPWILSKSDPSDPTKDGKSLDAKIQKGFADLDAAYAAVMGNSIPTPPSTWSSVNPSAADLMTPFGKLFTSVGRAVDPTIEDSIVAQMSYTANLLGFPVFQGG